MSNQNIDASSKETLLISIIKLAAIEAFTDDNYCNFSCLADIGPYKFSPSSNLDQQLLWILLEPSAELTESEWVNICNLRNTNDVFSWLFEVILPSGITSYFEYAQILRRVMVELMPQSYDETLAEFLIKVSAHECLGFLQYQFRRHRLPFELGEKTEQVLMTILQSYNVCEIIGLLWSSLKSQLARLRSGNISPEQAANSVIPNLERLLTRAKTENWQLTQFNRPIYLPQSRLSRIIFEQVLLMPCDGFCFSANWLSEAYRNKKSSKSLQPPK